MLDILIKAIGFIFIIIIGYIFKSKGIFQKERGMKVKHPLALWAFFAAAILLVPVAASISGVALMVKSAFEEEFVVLSIQILISYPIAFSSLSIWSITGKMPSVAFIPDAYVLSLALYPRAFTGRDTARSPKRDAYPALSRLL